MGDVISLAKVIEDRERALLDRMPEWAGKVLDAMDAKKRNAMMRLLDRKRRQRC